MGKTETTGRIYQLGDIRKQRIEPSVHPAVPQVQQIMETVLDPPHAYPLEPLLD